MKKLPTRTLEIEKLSHDGRGIARFQGKTQFVENALPNEQVEARVIQSRRRFDELTTHSVIKPATVRAEPPCPVYNQCGGCQLQHLQTAAQTQFKQDSALEQLKRFANLQPEQILAPVTGASEHYRSRARLSCWYHPRRDEYRIGFRVASSKDILNLSSCLVLHPQLERLLPLFAPLAKQLKLGKNLGHIDLQLHEVSACEEKAAFCLRLNQTLNQSQLETVQAFAEAQQCIAAIQVKGQQIQPLAGPASLAYHLNSGESRLEFNWGDFTQANRALNREMVDATIALLDPQVDERILDAFCGMGNFSIPLSRHAASVLGLEASKAMVTEAGHNASLNQRQNCTFAACDLMDAEALQGLALEGVSKALLDPPRDGAAELCRKLGETRSIRQLVYVSCNPNRLAHDAAILANAGFKLQTLQLLDMFPHSHHSEVITNFLRD